MTQTLLIDRALAACAALACAVLIVLPVSAQTLDAQALRDVAAANRVQGAAALATASANACAALADASACKDSACVIAVKAIASHARVCHGGSSDSPAAAALRADPGPTMAPPDPPTVGERALALVGDGLRAAFGAAPGIVGAVLNYRSAREATRANLALGIAQSDNARAQHEATVGGFAAMGGQIAHLGTQGFGALERSAASAFAAHARLGEAALARPGYAITAGNDATIAIGGSASRTTNTVACPQSAATQGGAGGPGGSAPGSASAASGAAGAAASSAQTANCSAGR